jgi:hypothetical protein
LPNGKVLVAGGYTVDGWANPTATTEIYDPTAGTWTTTGNMSTPRALHAATLLPNGKVLVAGGATSTGNANMVATAELYDPATGLWTATGTMASVRAFPIAVPLENGKVLVAGGAQSMSSFTATAELYDPATGLWTSTSAMASVRLGHAAVRLGNGKVLVAGGETGIPHGPYLSSVELYDPALGTWTATGSMTTERAELRLTALADGKVLATGGYGVNDVEPLTTEIYNPATGLWTFSGNLGASRYQHSAILLPNGKVLVAGGRSADSYISDAALYDPSAVTWAAMTPLLAARGRQSTTLLPNGKALLVGGDNGTSALSSAELYDSLGTAPPVTLSTLRMAASGAFQLTFTNIPIPGATFTVLSTTNLSLPLSNWTALGGATDLLPGQFLFTDPQATNNARRYYIVRLP